MIRPTNSSWPSPTAAWTTSPPSPPDSARPPSHDPEQSNAPRPAPLLQPHRSRRMPDRSRTLNPAPAKCSWLTRPDRPTRANSASRGLGSAAIGNDRLVVLVSEVPRPPGPAVLAGVLPARNVVLKA